MDDKPGLGLCPITSSFPSGCFRATAFPLWAQFFHLGERLNKIIFMVLLSVKDSAFLNKGRRKEPGSGEEGQRGIVAKAQSSPNYYCQENPKVLAGSPLFSIRVNSTNECGQS